ncbi:MAG: response regulator [Holosporales bacterium]|jgi:CheY-like chemotaxis protein/DNA-binding XRE family transcriptional regulator|nr:response regulator [Holosporales bacterium]
MDDAIGKKLREARDRCGLTLSDVGKKLGVSYQQIQKYEQGGSKVAASALYNILRLYGIDLEIFFEDVISHIHGDSCHVRKWLSGNNTVSTLLVVEDNPADEAITRMALEVLPNTNVVSVHNTRQMLDVLRYKKLCASLPTPNVVFLDLYIPHKGERPERYEGIRALKDIKRDPSTRMIPVIVLTNSREDDLMQQAYDSGAAGYVCKSMQFDSFSEHLVRCVKYWTETVALPSKRN